MEAQVEAQTENNRERVLYRVNGSISSWRVELALHEKNLPFTAKRLRVMSTPKETRTAAFLAINPRGKAPVLVEPDGTILNESLAILSWLEFRYPEAPLLDRADPAVLARQLCYVQESETAACHYEPLESLFLKRPEAMTEGERAQIRGALGDVRWELDLWERRLQENSPAGGGFIAGPERSLADCAFYPLLGYMVRRGLRLEGAGGQGWPGLADYARRFGARPSAQMARPQGWAPDQAGRADLFRAAEALS